MFWLSKRFAKHDREEKRGTEMGRTTLMFRESTNSTIGKIVQCHNGEGTRFVSRYKKDECDETHSETWRIFLSIKFIFRDSFGLKDLGICVGVCGLLHWVKTCFDSEFEFVAVCWYRYFNFTF